MNFISCLFCLFVCFVSSGLSQVKFIVEDFEGYINGKRDLTINGIFSYGNIDASVIQSDANKNNILGERYLHFSKNGQQSFGGWGKGIGRCIDLESGEDFFQFYARSKKPGKSSAFQIIIQEDDNGNGKFDSLRDDYWTKNFSVISDNWLCYSFPLDSFVDGNIGGDSHFNIGYRYGKVFSIIFRCYSQRTESISVDIDEIFFSRGRIQSILTDSVNSSASISGGYCSLGAWSKNSSCGDFSRVDADFNSMFTDFPLKKNFGVVHFFHPFSLNSDSDVFFPDKNKINEVIHRGYLPMITLENHFTNRRNKNMQPGLQSIINGDFDSFLIRWALQIQQLDGMVFLRILHEFNGDWYPWSISANQRDPQLLVDAFRHIHSIFKQCDVRNVKFIWCPNSMSLPQESWNLILNAYPGDDYVDFVGVDVYNGAGEGSVWRSFRKELVESYFLLSREYPTKPLLICEVACRERLVGECKSDCQSKADWIRQMSWSLQKEFPRVVLLVWFNETKTFRLDSSSESLWAFYRFIFGSDWFKSGLSFVYPLLRP